MENQMKFRTRRFVEHRLLWGMKMTRENPLLLPICSHCGKYKGIGPCKNPACTEYVGELETEKRKSSNVSINRECTICGAEEVYVCVQCGKGFCKLHSTGAEMNHLGSFHQHVGTCIECKQVVCEDCWILNPNGDILCLIHLEDAQKSNEFH